MSDIDRIRYNYGTLAGCTESANWDDIGVLLAEIDRLERPEDDVHALCVTARQYEHEHRRADAAESGLSEVLELMRRLADSGGYVEVEDQRSSYVVVQVDRDTWSNLQERAADGTGRAKR